MGVPCSSVPLTISTLLPDIRWKRAKTSRGPRTRKRGRCGGGRSRRARPPRSECGVSTTWFKPRANPDRLHPVSSPKTTACLGLPTETSSYGTSTAHLFSSDTQIRCVSVISLSVRCALEEGGHHGLPCLGRASGRAAGVRAVPHGAAGAAAPARAHAVHGGRHRQTVAARGGQTRDELHDHRFSAGLRAAQAERTPARPARRVRAVPGRGAPPGDAWRFSPRTSGPGLLPDTHVDLPWGRAPPFTALS